MVSPRQLTTASHSHVLTNVNCFSPDGAWIVYDVRPRQGDVFDGDRIERVRIADGFVETIYQARHGAHVGVATYHPLRDEVAFILGPEHPTPDFDYGPARRRGVIVDCSSRRLRNLDARDLAPPFTPGALRGGTHVHVFSPDGTRVSSTYEDHILDRLGAAGSHELNQRTIAVTNLDRPVAVGAGDHNHDGSFTTVVVRTFDRPMPGSDEIERAFEDAWIGTNGYVRADGTRQRYAIAFQGTVRAHDGSAIHEVFVVDVPDDMTIASDRPLEGTTFTRPAPPSGCMQQRLTFTAERRFSGIQGPRHWLRSSPDGSAIAFLMKDDAGVVQLWTVAPGGGEPRQVTTNADSIASAFTWSAGGSSIAHVMGRCVCVTDVRTGTTRALTVPMDGIRPHACVLNADGSNVAVMIETPRNDGRRFDQIWLVPVAR